MKYGQLIIGVGGLIASAKSLWDAFYGDAGLGDANSKLLGVGARRPVSVKVHSVNTITERVRHIQNMIRKGRRDGRIRALAVQLVSRKCGPKWCINERDYDGELRALFRFVRSKVRYVRDAYGADTFQHPMRTLQWGGEDCDGYVILLASLAQAIGYPVRLRVMKTNGSRDWNHILLLAGLPPRQPTRWMSLDASVNHPAGWYPPRGMVNGFKDFLVE